MAKTYSYNRQADMPGLDPDEEKLYDVLWMYASNDGESYRKRDAGGAVTKAWREYLRDHQVELQETYRSIQKKLMTDLAKRWKSGGV